jgi:hypothetical protein
LLDEQAVVAKSTQSPKTDGAIVFMRWKGLRVGSTELASMFIVEP